MKVEKFKSNVPPRRNRFGASSLSARASPIPWEHHNPLIEAGALAEFVGYITESEFCASANRSLSPLHARWLVRGFALLCILVAGFSYLQGNVIAPVFLAINALILTVAVLAIRRACDSGDYLKITDNGRLQVLCKRRGHVARFNVTIAQTRLTHDRVADAVILEYGVKGINDLELRLGEFLNPDQREQMFERLGRFLSLAKAQLVSKL
jgi:uncharacterized membrane protein